MHYIKGLNALRALSVALVIMSHVGILAAVSSPALKSFFTVFNAFTGVMFFFVISGFLITTLLIAEKERTGTIGIKNFFARRALRILPLYYLALLIAALFGFFGVQKIPVEALINGVTYTYNFVQQKHNVGFLSHLWSLAVEEQFYLIWPFLFLLMIGKPWRLVVLCMVCTLICYSVARSFNWYDPIHNIYYLGRWFIPAAYPIFIGCIFALVLHYNAAAKRMLGSWACLAIALAFLAVPLVFRHTLSSLNQQYLVAVGVGLLICWISRNQHRKTVQALEVGPIAYMGKISYGLYVWQGIFTGNGNIDSHHWPPQPFAIGVALTLVVSVISYHWFEMPFLRMKKRFSWTNSAAQASTELYLASQLSGPNGRRPA
ncbi:O-acetyltransferase OatA [Achromobacter xylosoxidans]|nr:O-acetyltransferase OatA [Achromobacter xylosoxidans]